MSKYLGDFSASSIVDFKFTTFRPSTGAPFTLAGTPVVSVYKDNDLTQSTAGVTLTVDFDGVTGMHHVRITTATDGTFYANGGEFECVITAGTVDSVSVVGSCIGRFTLRSQASLYPTTAGNTLDVNANGEAGIDWANVGNPTTTLALSNTTIANVTVGSIATNAITAASIATGAIDADSIAADAITAAKIATGAIDADAIAADAITAAKIATGAIDADAIAADAITSAKIANSAISIRLATDGTPSEARIETGAVAADVWNALLASYTTANTFGARIVRTRSTSPSNEVTITGSFHIAADVHEIQPATITAADFVAGAIDANALATDAVTEIAAGTWNYDISAISTPGTAGLFLTDTNVDTSNILSSVATIEASTTVIESIAYKQSMADYLLGRNIAGGSDGGRTVKDAFRALRNKSEIVGTTLTVYQENDTTSAWTATVSSNASADPVTGIDPA
jgi:hypothetical protein